MDTTLAIQSSLSNRLPVQQERKLQGLSRKARERKRHHALSKAKASANRHWLGQSAMLPFLIAVITFIASITFNDYFSRTSKEFATKVLLFTAGSSSALAASIYKTQSIDRYTKVAKELESSYSELENQENLAISQSEIAEEASTESNFASKSLPTIASTYRISDKVVGRISVVEVKGITDARKAASSVVAGESVVLNTSSLDKHKVQQLLEFVDSIVIPTNSYRQEIAADIHLYTPQSVIVQRPYRKEELSQPSLLR